MIRLTPHAADGAIADGALRLMRHVRRQEAQLRLKTAVSAAAIGAVAVMVLAGDWQPDPDRPDSLTISGGCSEVTEDQHRWGEQLVANLGKHSPFTIRSFEVVPACPMARLELKGVPSTDHRVFRQSESRYLANSIPDPRDDSYLVDFEAKYVLQMGGIGTTSIHPHTQGHFAVIVYTHDPVVYGIGVFGEAGNPTFELHRATWY